MYIVMLLELKWIMTFVNGTISYEVVIIKNSNNSDGQQFIICQQNEHPPQIFSFTPWGIIYTKSHQRQTNYKG